MHKNQVADDRDVYERMQSDLNHADKMFQPTNYWSKYVNETIRVLREEGLKNFRRQPWGYFRSFGAADFSSTDEFQKLFLQRSDLSKTDQDLVLRYLDFIDKNRDLPLLPFNISRSDLDHMAARTAEVDGARAGAKPLLDIEPSLIGNPLHVFDYRGKRYTHYFLEYYMRYAYTERHIDFQKVDNIVELGSGAGNQVEVLKKCYPHLTFYLLDLAPYLYVCHQFMKSVFPEDVVDYRETRQQKEVTASRKGQILHLGNWKLGDVRPQGTTLFWNSASFGEMEPDVVQNYLSLIRDQSTGVYLYQCMGGKEVGREGKGGVLQQTKFHHYHECLQKDFRLVDQSDSYQPMRPERTSGGYQDALWIRKEGVTILK